MKDDRNNGSNRPKQNISRDMAQFYQALGTFNANMIARLNDDPSKIRDIIKDLVAYCPVHDAQCGDNYVYDHTNNMCIRLVEIAPEGGGDA